MFLQFTTKHVDKPLLIFTVRQKVFFICLRNYQAFDATKVCSKVLTISGKRLLTRTEHDLAVVVNGKQLENVQCAKLLGLEIDQELTFIPHIDKLCKKLSQRIGILKKIRYCLPLKYRLLFYNAMIRPVMAYVNRVLKLQKRDARIILDADSQASSVKLFNKRK